MSCHTVMLRSRSLHSSLPSFVSLQAFLACSCCTFEELRALGNCCYALQAPPNTCTHCWAHIPTHSLCTDFHILATVPDVDLASTPGCTEGETFDPAARANLRGASLMACTPHSGRTHQIRLHLAHVGHPIVGDELYGVSGPWIGRQALHAARLGFTHPLTGVCEGRRVLQRCALPAGGLRAWAAGSVPARPTLALSANLAAPLAA